MVPIDYHLDEVCSRLITRFEASRRSYLDQPQQLDEALHRIASEVLSQAVAEYREFSGTDRVAAQQVRLLEQEVHATFMPRYLRLAKARNAEEADPWRLETWNQPLRKLVLVGLAFIGVWVGLRALGRPILAPIAVVLMLAPFLPLWAVRVGDGQHAMQLQQILDDMQKIQEQATSYVPPDLLGADAPNRSAKPERGTWQS